jgi:hypothetical protein
MCSFSFFMLCYVQVTVVLATQLLPPFKSVTCSENPGDDDGGDDDNGDDGVACSDKYVNTYSVHTYKDSDGPERFTNYSLVCLGIGVVSLLIFTPFLPRTKAECAKWKKYGEEGKFWLSPKATGLCSTFIAVAMVGYVLVASVAFLNPSTACLAAFGGSGC